MIRAKPGPAEDQRPRQGEDVSDPKVPDARERVGTRCGLCVVSVTSYSPGPALERANPFVSFVVSPERYRAMSKYAASNRVREDRSNDRREPARPGRSRSVKLRRATDGAAFR